CGRRCGRPDPPQRRGRTRERAERLRAWAFSRGFHAWTVLEHYSIHGRRARGLENGWTGVAGPLIASGRAITSTGGPSMRVRYLCPLLLACVVFSGCAAAMGAAVAAREIRQGFSGVQQLVASSRSLLGGEAALPATLETPLAGTYRATQVLDSDTVVFYVRTVARPTAPILDAEGKPTGYALAGLAAASLDSLESRIGRGGAEGSAVFFVEGTAPPAAGGRTLYAAAFLGRLPEGDSPRADSLNARLV